MTKQRNPWDSLVAFVNRHHISPVEEMRLREVINEINESYAASKVAEEKERTKEVAWKLYLPMSRNIYELTGYNEGKLAEATIRSEFERQYSFVEKEAK